MVDASDECWIGEAEKELHTPIPTEQGPLLRSVIIKNGNACGTLLLTFHHSIGDAMSGVYLVRDLIDVASRLIKGEDAFIPELPLKEAIEAYYPGSVKGVTAFFKAVHFTLRSLWTNVRWGNPVLPEVDQKFPLNGRRSKIISREISPEMVERMVKAARGQKTTIHCMLASACALAVLCDRNKQKKETIIINSDVNLREKLVPPVKDDIGFFISGNATLKKIRQDSDFWELAKSIRKSLARCLYREEALFLLKIVGFTDLALRLVGNRRLASQVYASITEVTTPGLFELSNIGALEIKHHYEPLSINRIGFAGSFSATAAIGLYVATLNNHMVCNFIGMAPLYSRKHIESIADKVIGILAGI